jgi:hypothetical protein
VSVDNVQVAFPLFQEGRGGAVPTSAHQEVEERYLTYDKEHCWQYDIRLQNRGADLELANLSEDDVKNLSTKDFTFRQITSEEDKRACTLFIKRHEWLGTLSQFTTHWYAAYYRGILAGVILMNMPNAFSKLLGEETRTLERLVSRGACISWSPPNLASNFLMWCIKDMVKKTNYRLFTAYSDPTARELGTIYQACNFYYLGQGAGTTKRYINPYSGKMVSDRFFRVRSAYKKYAKDLGIVWEKNYNNDQKMLWDNVPDTVEALLRQYSKEMQASSKVIIYPSKHKYAYVQGRDKKETAQLRALFESRNKVKPYPKERKAE